MLVDRMVLLDHLTRGRGMLGCGPGQLTSDAHMLGISADQQRPRMEQSLDAIVGLLHRETVTMHTDRFTLRDARLQLKPYSDPCFDRTTPITWLIGQRIQARLALLECTSLSIEQISARVGFDSPVTYRHHFARALRTTPSEYRSCFTGHRVVGA